MSSESRRATLSQVAKLAGVSVMTASYTYNRPGRVSAESRTKVLEAAESLGYPGPNPSARSLRRGSTGTLGVVLGENLTYAFDDPQATSFLAGVAEVCADQGLGLTILPITGSKDDGARIRAAAVDAFVVWTLADDDPVLAAVQATGRPAVIHGGPRIDGFELVTIDNRSAARAIGTVAFSRSARPAVISFPLDRERRPSIGKGVDPADARFPITRQRLMGFRDAADNVGVDWTDVVVAVCATNDAREAEAVTTELLGGSAPPDAIAAMSDEQAAGVLKAAAGGRYHVPADLAVTGWDDAPAARELGITTVAQSLREQGTACAFAAIGTGARADRVRVDQTPGGRLDKSGSNADQPWSIVLRSSAR